MEYRGFEVSVPAGVYEPREDTELLADAAERIKGKDVLDMGCGSGMIALILAKNGNRVTAADVDKRAVDATTENALRNRLKIWCVQSDLFEKVEGRFDYVLFNFPYLPEKMTEENRAWAAGERIEVIRRFAAQAGGHLKPGGRILFVASSLTGLHEVVQIFTWRGFNVRILKERKIPWETLFLAQAEFIRRPKE